MADARVIPLDGDGRSRRAAPASKRGQQERRASTSTASRRAPVQGRAADTVAAGAARASGERRRRTSTPLISEPPPGVAEMVHRPPDTGVPDLGPAPSDLAPPEPDPDLDPDLALAAEESIDALQNRRLRAAPPLAAEQDWERRLAGGLAFLRRRLTGDYSVDEFGFDPELNDTVLMSLARPLYQKYFRVETRGLENVPSSGGALLVANHSGTVPLDSVMTQLALLDDHPAHRHLRMLGADLVFSTPFVGALARKGGTTLACNADALRLLGRDELVGVWPEGFKGIGKPFTERYKLQRFGRGGFVSAALSTRVPIIPCSIVGAEEIYPILGNLPTLARVLGVPYVPMTPTFPWLGPLGAIPLPSKWIIEFGEPIPTDHYADGAAEDPMLVFNLTDQVRETIQHTLYKLLMQRRSVFF